jgi:serine/threonine protein kinase
LRTILTQVFEAVAHLHEKELMHGDLKLLNVVRFRRDNRLRLIDFDASAKIVPSGVEDK